MLRKIIMLAVAVLLALSCSDLDPQPVRSKYYEADLELNEKYFDKVCGEWYNEKIDDTKKIYESLKLTSDKNCVLTIKVMSRKIVKIDGVDTYTDWELTFDETQSGTWVLGYSDFNDSTEPYLQLNIRGESNYTLSNFYPFNGVDDTSLLVELIFFNQLKRGHEEPSF